MNLKLQHTFQWRFKLAVLFLYIPFFAVQCFFNYSNIVQGNSGAVQSEYFKTSTGKKVELKAKPANKQLEVNLNKRFQPGLAPCCSNISIEALPCFAEKKLFDKFTSVFHSVNCLNDGTLRGPPVVA